MEFVASSNPTKQTSSGTSSDVAILAHASASTVLSLAPKSATTGLVGNIPALMAALTILTVER
jgi:hypothetical protein